MTAATPTQGEQPHIKNKNKKERKKENLAAISSRKLPAIHLVTVTLSANSMAVWQLLTIGKIKENQHHLVLKLLLSSSNFLELDHYSVTKMELFHHRDSTITQGAVKILWELSSLSRVHTRWFKNNKDEEDEQLHILVSGDWRISLGSIRMNSSRHVEYSLKTLNMWN